MKKFLMTCTLCFGLVGNAFASDFKVVCEIQNGWTLEVLAKGEASLTPQSPNDPHVHEIELEADLGEHGKAILKSMTKLIEDPAKGKTYVTVNTYFKLPDLKMSVGNVDVAEVQKTTNGIALVSKGTMTLGYDLYYYGCVIHKQ